MSEKKMNNHDLLIRVDATIRGIQETMTKLSRDVEKLDGKLDNFREEEIRLSERFNGHVEGHKAADRRTERNVGIISAVISAVIGFLSRLIPSG